MLNCLFVGIGGFVGSILRYLVGLLPIETENGFPVKTLVINIVGAFLLGLITAMAAKNKSLNPQVILMLRVGVCGGFTTFSTFAYESTELMRSGHMATGIIYICASMVLGVLAVFAAQMLVK